MPETNPLSTLATFLTAPGRVARHSMGLQMGGEKKEEAERFFELRSAFGVEGYVTTKQGERAINHAVTELVRRQLDELNGGSRP